MLALKGLGFTAREARSAVDAAVDAALDDPPATLEELLRSALRPSAPRKTSPR